VRRYDAAKSLFMRALEEPPERRDAFVSREAAGDEGLRREVEELLAFHDESGAGDEDPLPADPLPLRVGPWRLDCELGRGGLGVVYLARRDDGPPVALKVLRGGLLSPQLMARFRREATVLARLDHPGIARSIETGVDEGPRGPTPWIAMERIEGRSLRSWAAAAHTVAERLELMARVCDAVQHAHERGVVHRDLKPENILVREDGRPVVLDFGIARLVDSDVRATTLQTTVGVLVGTIRYMSPEQADARPDRIGPRSDVHQLAALTYELVTGRLPYHVPEDSVHRALVAVITSPPRPMEELPPKLRRPLERVLRAALAKDPERRLASAGELAADLRRVASGRAPHARPAPGHRPAWLVAATAAASLAVVAAAVAWITGRIGPPPSPFERFEGTLRPAATFRRAMVEADSMTVRLHYNTRVLPRLREALAHGERAMALLETTRSRPWAAEALAYVGFRLGEARYLVAERTYDPGLYRAAAETWYACRETSRPTPRVPTPDTLGIIAGGVVLPAGTEAWRASAKAWDELARLADRERAHARAFAVRREGLAVFLGGAGDTSLLSTPLAPQPEWRLALAGWLQGLGASHSNLGFDRGDTAEVRLAIAQLRRAASVPGLRLNDARHASVLHDLGTAFLRGALLEHSAGLLDSSFACLRLARALRLELPGYTSAVLSSCGLARAFRVAAWWAPDSASRDLALRNALDALDPRVHSETRYEPGDLALLALARAEVRVDLGCGRRDPREFERARRDLSFAWSRLPEGRLPVLAAQADEQRLRLALLSLALTGSPSSRARARQVMDRLQMNARGTTARQRRRLASAKWISAGSLPRRFDLRVAFPDPF